MNSYFLQFSKNIYSQCGEDGIVEKLFDLLDIKNGIVVEFGAMDGVELSNTHRLWKTKNFKSVMIEMCEQHTQTLRNIENNFENVEAHICMISPDSNDYNSLDNILSRSKFEINDDNFILVSIDVDSCDYHIFNSLSKYKPKIVIIETNTNFNFNEEYVSHDNGCSLYSVNKLAESKGYKLICHTGNAIFVRTDLIDFLPKENYNLEDLYCNNDCVRIQQNLK
jgi:hypothetical protein